MIPASSCSTLCDSFPLTLGWTQWLTFHGCDKNDGVSLLRLGYKKSLVPVLFSCFLIMVEARCQIVSCAMQRPAGQGARRGLSQQPVRNCGPQASICEEPTDELEGRASQLSLQMRPQPRLTLTAANLEPEQPAQPCLDCWSFWLFRMLWTFWNTHLWVNICIIFLLDIYLGVALLHPSMYSDSVDTGK